MAAWKGFQRTEVVFAAGGVWQILDMDEGSVLTIQGKGVQCNTGQFLPTTRAASFTLWAAAPGAWPPGSVPARGPTSPWGSPGSL